MGQANLNNDRISFKRDLDSIIITTNLQDKRGGVSLDFTDFKGTFVRAGHIVIYKEGVEDSHKPMPVTADYGTYEALPEGYSYYGFTINTHLKNKQANGVAIRGNRNPKVVDATNGYYAITPAILTALKAAELTRHFTYLGDND